jgi:hypothetical protein
MVESVDCEELATATGVISESSAISVRAPAAVPATVARATPAVNAVVVVLNTPTSTR